MRGNGPYLMLAAERPRTRSAVGRSVGALADQALFAGANFAVTVMLARWLPVDEFGAFTVGFTVYLLIGTAHNGLVVEPMLVFGSGKLRAERDKYFSFLIRLHWSSTLLAAAAVLLAAVFAIWFDYGELGRALVGASVAVPLGLFYWLARRVPYLTAEPWKAVSAGVQYVVLSTASIWCLKVIGGLGAATALVCIGASGLVAATTLMRGLGRVRAPSGTAGDPYWRSQWNYARWSLVTGLIGFVPSQGLVLAAPIFLGLGAAATMKIALTPVGPVMQATAALSMLLLPKFVVRAESQAYTASVRRTAIALIIAASGCSAVIFAFRGEIMKVIFGADAGPSADALAYLAWIPVFATAVNVFAASLRAVEAPKPVFSSYLMAAAVTICVGLPMLGIYGVNGGAAAMLVAYGLNATTMWLFSERTSIERQPNPLRAVS